MNASVVLLIFRKFSISFSLVPKDFPQISYDERMNFI